MPHVEEDGRVCLGVVQNPLDYDEPCSAVTRVLAAFEAFLEKCEDATWIEREFQNERLAYWSRFSLRQHRRRTARPVLQKTFVVLEQLTGAVEGTLASFNKGKTAVVCCGNRDPNSFARRHEIGRGAMSKGQALFVPMSGDEPWTPETWPKTLPVLEGLVQRLTLGQTSVVAWLNAKASDCEGPFIVVLVQGTVLYGYQIFRPVLPLVAPPAIEPIRLDRLDASWSLSRDHQSDTFTSRQKAKVLVLGCGSLGSPLIESLARAGVGNIDIVDVQPFEPENCSRHVLGLSAIGAGKAANLARKLLKEVPEIKVRAFHAFASSFIADCCKPGAYDVIVECTGETSVRTLLSRYRESAVAGTPLALCWLEPFCAAAHVVGIHPKENWPSVDPADSAVNVADWPEDTRVNLPACSAGFHPYGVADVWQAAGFAGERVLSILDDGLLTSAIWTWVRSNAFFENIGIGAKPRPIVPTDGSRFDSRMITRPYTIVQE
ncbi:hypothetical protein CYJ10_30945 [Cupriavidus pauculus]|uniref:THIF-type NAD/FAD binding fold domain-containing protein n=1 Tax=Cupriavidus pauculus TaxID=82633 RepID=A0A2N5C340_9BURK|nr:hypothetical protein CYJ10_30945 [Cupriavidus pauculus]